MWGSAVEPGRSAVQDLDIVFDIEAGAEEATHVRIAGVVTHEKCRTRPPPHQPLRAAFPALAFENARPCSRRAERRARFDAGPVGET